MNKKLTSILISLLVLLALSFAFTAFDCNTNAKFNYQHDPRENPSAMADIVEDENAIYVLICRKKFSAFRP